MDTQEDKIRQALIDYLINRIIPLEQQLEAQSNLIEQLSQTVNELSSIISPKPIQNQIQITKAVEPSSSSEDNSSGTERKEDLIESPSPILSDLKAASDKNFEAKFSKFSKTENLMTIDEINTLKSTSSPRNFVLLKPKVVNQVRSHQSPKNSETLKYEDQGPSKSVQPSRRFSLRIEEPSSIKGMQSPRRDSLISLDEQRLKEEKKKAADLEVIRKAFAAGLTKLKAPELTQDQIDSKDAGEPDSEIEDEIDREEELQIIDIELSQLEDFKDASVPEFYYNDLSLGAIGTLAELSPEKLILDNKPPPKVRWILALFWQIQGLNYQNDEVWEEWKKYIQENIGKLDQAFFDLRSKLDFSMKNLDKIEKLLRKRKNLLNPALFGYCPTASHLMAILKNIIEFSGTVSSASVMRYNRLVYKKSEDLHYT